MSPAQETELTKEQMVSRLESAFLPLQCSVTLLDPEIKFKISSSDGKIFINCHVYASKPLHIREMISPSFLNKVIEDFKSKITDKHHVVFGKKWNSDH